MHVWEKWMEPCPAHGAAFSGALSGSERDASLWANALFSDANVVSECKSMAVPKGRDK